MAKTVLVFVGITLALFCGSFELIIGSKLDCYKDHVIVVNSSNEEEEEKPYQNQIFVPASGGNCTSNNEAMMDSCQCEESLSVCTCCELSDALNILRNSTELIIEKDINLLTYNITIQNLTEVSIRSGISNNQAVIDCDNTSVNIAFSLCTDLVFSNLIITGCGSTKSTTGYLLDPAVNKALAALVIINCSNIFINNLIIQNSLSLGMNITDSIGFIMIRNSRFESNGRQYFQSFNDSLPLILNGGGLDISMNGSIPGPAFIELKNCTFENNIKSLWNQKRNSNYGFGKGGGLKIKIHGNRTPVPIRLHIHNVNFINNKAENGGGAWIDIDYISSTTISIILCIFENNTADGAMVSNGGGLHIRILGRCDKCHNNNIRIESCYFNNNSAYFGGGTSLDCGKLKGNNSKKQQFSLNFTTCQWHYNKATSGAAVDVSQHYTKNRLTTAQMIIPIFKNCEFTHNSIHYNSDQKIQVGYGIFSLVEADVIFLESVQFTSNNGTALSATISTVHFYPHCVATFHNNTSISGGAVSLTSARLKFYKKVALYFANNKAVKHGHDIYSVVTDDHMLFSEAFCPFTFNETKCIHAKDHCGIKIHIYIENSTSTNHIYLPSLLPCRITFTSSRSFSHLTSGIDIFKNKIFQFTFPDDDDIKSYITTAPRYHTLHNNQTNYHLYPGQRYQLRLTLEDEFHHIVNSVILEAISQSTNITLHDIYVYNYTFGVLGRPMATSKINFQTITKPLLVFSINVTLDQCPPGYVYDGREQRCKCAEDLYYGVIKCSPTDEIYFNTSIRRGVWCGYVEGQFVTSPCHWFFKYEPKQLSIPIPKHLNSTSDFLCTANREGTLCGRCKDGYTTYYHDDRFHCHANSKQCNLGTLYFLLAEILPVTLTFVYITITGFNVASGYVQGFFLYTHILCSLAGFGTISISNHASTLFNYFVKALYFPLNTKFFYFKNLSFCIAKDMTSLEIASINYIKAIYSVLLIVIVVAFLKCFALRCHWCGRWLRFTTAKASTVVGMSALLVLSYTSAVETSLMILEPSPLFAKNYHTLHYRVALYGEEIYFGKEHQKYAIFACTCLLILLVPSLMLLTYPLVQSLLSYLDIDAGQSLLGKILTKGYMYNSLKPFYDMFYACFKDKHRYFAGLYFIYRILIQLSYYVPSYTESSFIMETFLISFLVIHATVQPYQKRIHNIIDALLLGNLTIINGLTCADMIIVYNTTHRHYWNPAIAAYFQMGLAVLPMLVVLCCLIWKYFLYKVAWTYRYIQMKYRNYESIEESTQLEYNRHVSLHDQST